MYVCKEIVVYINEKHIISPRYCSTFRVMFIMYMYVSSNIFKRNDAKLNDVAVL